MLNLIDASDCLNQYNGCVSLNAYIDWTYYDSTL